MSSEMPFVFPSLAAITTQAAVLANRITRTPVWEWNTPLKNEIVGADTPVSFKLELLQRTGSFKARGALTVIDGLSADQRAKGVVAGSAGNHGIAVAFAARSAEVRAKIAVPKTINPFRLAAIKAYGAEIEMVDHVGQVLDRMNQIAADDGRTTMHPFENPRITLGTGTLGLEWLEQMPDLDVVIVPIGGGGLASGVACAVKQVRPGCKVYGVEPVGAPSMARSLAAGKPIVLAEPPRSIADSLSAPRSEPYSFAACQKYLDDVVLIDDDAMRVAMKLLFEDVKLAVEPAGAAATAGLLGPLRERCSNKKTGVIICGANIDPATFDAYLNPA